MSSDLSHILSADPAVLETYYEQYLQDPGSLDVSWRRFFEGFDLARRTSGDGTRLTAALFEKETQVLNLIGAYRLRGHLFTKTNPVRTRRKYDDPLTLESFGLAESDLDTVFQAGAAVGLGPARLRDIVALLEETYCHSVAVEYKYVRDPRVVNWLQTRMESARNRRHFTPAERMHILRQLTRAVLFEKFMHSRFVGQKRFSLEGMESVIPALDAIVERGAELGIGEFVIGMAHRGRLNVLANILHKPLEHIFAEFAGEGFVEADFAGDVKYHLGYSCERTTAKGHTVRLSLAPNPSHLEAVGPVVTGIVRARQDHWHGGDSRRSAAILIHGDSAIAGQGVVYELLQMSLLDAYRTGGTIHIVLNNQVGFTTNYLDARSSTYCTDVGKVTLSPVFHVNGDDVEAVIYVIELALEFRQTFQRDVFIDVLGYRKHGHNEGDEPRFTQPILYRIIAAHPNPQEIYLDALRREGAVEEHVAREMETEFRRLLEEKYDLAAQVRLAPDRTFLADAWHGFRFAEKEEVYHSPETGVPLDELQRIAARITHLPPGPKFFAKIQRIFEERRRAMEAGTLDWALGELLAYGTLVNEGVPVRLSGQDSERGTFSHRHAVVKIEDSEEEYVPLNHVREGQAPFAIYNSLLSEYAVLGFEYGYALAAPQGLTIWEAQYGDFANVAQVVVDQFLACAESKWQLMNGLVLFLPHGYEGQGPDHSSARIERFLSLCAEENLQVVNCTTPANFFHVLRRQVRRPFRKPLVVFTPKSLLRHPRCTSPLADFGPQTRFRELLDDSAADAAQVQRVLLCSGKIFYELQEKKEREGRKDTALVRLEQLYPLPEQHLQAIFTQYHRAPIWRWVQEEPANMGAWPFLRLHWNGPELERVSRPEAASPATGFPAQHLSEQQAILEQAFA